MFRSVVVAAALAALIAGPAAAKPKGPFDFESLYPAPEPVSRPEGPAHRVGLSRVVFDIPLGMEWLQLIQWNVFGNFPTEVVPWSAAPGDASTAAFESIFQEELRFAGFPADSGGDLFDTQDADPELLVGARIIELRAKLCAECPSGGRGRTGSLLMHVEWQIYSPLERRVLATTTTASAVGTNQDARRALAALLPAAFRWNVQHLLQNQTFRDVVISPKAAVGAVATSGPLSPLPITMAPPGPRPVGEAARGVATIYATGGHGSGFLVSDQGYLLTNQHVVGGARYVKVRWADGSEELGEVLRADRARDVALVKVAATKRSPLAIRTGAVGAGETVYAIGTPLDDKYDATITRGVVSANRVEDGRPFIQSDVTVNHGNSGGPLIDEAGQVVGITASGLELNGVPAGINLFIPIGDALDKLALKPAA